MTDHTPILILARADDELALRVGALLQVRCGRAAVRIVSVEELVFAARWCHRVGEDGVCTEIELADGSSIVSDSIGVVLNRLGSVDPEHFGGSRGVDREYAAMETHALWLSWLAGLSAPVLNPATPRGLSGPERGSAEWLHLASRAGLPIRGWQISTGTRRFFNDAYERHLPRDNARRLQDTLAAAPRGPDVGAPWTSAAGNEPALFLQPVGRETYSMVIVGDRVVGPLAGPWDGELTTLSEISGCPLLEVSFARAPGEYGESPETWRVCRVSPWVVSQDDAVVRAVCELLERRATTTSKLLEDQAMALAMPAGEAPVG